VETRRKKSLSQSKKSPQLSVHFFAASPRRRVPASPLPLSRFLDSFHRPSLSSQTASEPPGFSSLLSKRIETEAESVIKLDIVNRVADRTGVPKMKAEQAVDALFHSMKDALMRGERIELRGFGVFVVKPRKRGVGRNPRTGEEVAIPSGKTIRFKPGKELQAHEGGTGDDSGQTPTPSLPDAEY
jgi:DNA-binding protein HU-beta